jgi:hypothetical protein
VDDECCGLLYAFFSSVYQLLSNIEWHILIIHHWSVHTMRSPYNCQKLHRYLLPVALTCLLVALVSISGCITGLPGLSGISLSPTSGSSTGAANPPAYDTSQAQATQASAPGTSGECGVTCPLNSQCVKGECLCNDGYAATSDGRCIPAPTFTPTITASAQSSGGGYTCPLPYESYTVCSDNNCYDLTSDPTHCGSCTNACSSGQTCTSGQCVGITGQTGGSSTGQTVCNGQNVDLMTDNVNCGACGNVCDGCKPCVQGSCQYQVGVCDYCTQNSDCVGDRFPTTGFAQNHYTWVCKNNGETNSCIVDCAPSYKACSPLVCTNVQTDASNCGSCGNACSTGRICLAGQCSINPALLARKMCAYPNSVCNGNCVNTQTDASNCGLCGTKCPTGGSCSSGVCACPTGYINSNGVCSKLQVVVTLSAYKKIVSNF